jgi:hypothetical protein
MAYMWECCQKVERRFEELNEVISGSVYFSLYILTVPKRSYLQDNQNDEDNRKLLWGSPQRVRTSRRGATFRLVNYLTLL